MSAPLAIATGWHPEDIKAAVRKRGTTLTKLALDNHLSESACRGALHRSLPSGEKVISAFLNVPLQDLWPHRYDPHGRRLATRNVREDRAGQAGAHGLIGTAR